MLAHDKPIKEVMALLNTNEKGLSKDLVVTLQQQYGKNELQERKKKSNLSKFINQFKDIMILILLLAALISFVTAIMEKNTSAFFEPFLILFIVVCNAIMGVLQENKAEKSLEALMSLATPHARVIRDGNEQIIDAKDLVPGDIIKLEAGDFVPGDARLLQSRSLKSEESALTGESVPSDKDASCIVDKNAALGDRHNMLYAGCSISNGTALAVVVATGMTTEMGKIANLLEHAKDTRTPLQNKLAELGKYLGFLAIAVCIIIFIMGIFEGMAIMEIFMTAVSLAVSAIPEGLPVIVTVVLSIGVERMAKRQAVVKSLPAVETLGSTSVICSDKTGTLTQNRMTLVKGYYATNDIEENISENNSPGICQLLTCGTLCSNGTIDTKDGKIVHIGDPTETSIVLAAKQNQIEQSVLTEKSPRLYEIPFDSNRKLMTVVCQIEDKLYVITKGAFDNLITKCNLSKEYTKAIDINKKWSQEAIRVIAIASKQIDTLEDIPNDDELESNLTFMGLVGMIDPPRQEAKEAVSLCKQAGIKPIMITGDHVVTASAIARQLGILNSGQKAITGSELANMDDDELEHIIDNIRVYARVSPEDKIRVVRAWQRKGQIVSMTGDGVNDAPALKAADIGCAMGITGTDVAKGAADLTLMDDNFATIVEAVKEGRGIYCNIKKTVGFLLGTNIGEVILVFMAMLFWQQAPLLSMQLLWINLVTDSLPAIALGMEPIEEGVMEEKPRPRNEGIFAHGLGVRIVLQGVMFGILPLFAFRYGYLHGGLEIGRTMAFMVLGTSQVFQSYNMRSNHSLFKIGVFSNKMLNKAALVSLGLMMVVLFIPPITTIFGLVALPLKYYAFSLAISFIPVVVIETLKAMEIIK